MNDAALIARDVWAHIDEAASHLLDDTVAAFDLEAGGEDEKDGFVSAVGGIKPSSIAFAQLAEAAWWLEVVAAHDPGHRPRVDRNRGLAYSFSLRVIAPPMASHTLAKLGSGGHDDIFGDLGRNVTKWYDPWQWSDWRIWAANRLIDTWATYLGRAEAKRDWDYGRIEQLYELANKARSEAGWV